MNSGSSLSAKAKIKGQVIGRVIELDEIGLKKLEVFRAKWGNPLLKTVQYCEERDAIYAQHGHRKLRTTSLKGQTWSMLKATHFKLSEIFEVIKYEMAINHNIVTDEGDAMIADLMAQTPARVKVDNTNGHIQVGTGWTGTTPKLNTILNTPSGTPEVMDATYPKVKGAFGAANDNVTQYRSTFEAGDLNVVSIDEAGLANNIAPASWDLLAYGQITPTIDVSTPDTLQVDWELTFLGA